jgi:hypothetical protein
MSQCGNAIDNKEMSAKRQRINNHAVEIVRREETLSAIEGGA